MVKYFSVHSMAGLLAFASSQAGLTQTEQSGQTCQDIDTASTVAADVANFSSDGSIDSGPLQGTTHFTGDPESVVAIVSQVSPPLEPMTFSYTGDTVISAQGGVLTLRGAGVFERKPFGAGTLFSRVLTGTGGFAGATGSLYFNFSSDDQGNLTGTLTGSICTPTSAPEPPAG